MFEGLEMFSTLSSTELEKLSSLCQQKNLSVGETLFSEGDEANAMYIVKSGELEAFSGQGDDQKKLGDVGAEGLLGEMVVLGGEKTRTATVIATKNSVLITMLSFSIQELAESNPEVFTKIQNIIEKRREENKERK